MRKRLLVILGACVAVFIASFAHMPATRAVTASRIVSMGDSYQAGVGTGQYYPGSGECYRSPWSHMERLLSAGMINPPLTFVACNGATTDDLINGKSGEPSQLTALGSDVSLVTIGITGNDMKFSTVLKNCILTSALKSCQGTWDEQLWTIYNSLAQGTTTNSNRLQDLLKQIHADAQQAAIFVLTYPKFFPANGGSDWTSGVSIPTPRCQMIRVTDQLWMNQWIQRLDNYIVSSAAIFGATPVDLYHAPDGHELCSGSKDRYLNGIVPTRVNLETFHPTRYGYAQTACILLDAFAHPNVPARVAGDDGATRQASDVTVQPGQTVRVPVRLKGGGLGTGFGTTWAGGDGTVRVVAPDGTPAGGARHRRAVTKNAVYDNLYVPGAAGGAWTVELTGRDGPSRVRVTVTELARPKRPPTAKLTIKRTGPTVVLNASSSTGSDGGPVKRYLWEFADGKFATGGKVTHTFTRPGTYTVTLAVTGADDQLGFGAAPPVTVSG